VGLKNVFILNEEKIIIRASRWKNRDSASNHTLRIPQRISLVQFSVLLWFFAYQRFRTKKRAVLQLRYVFPAISEAHQAVGKIQLSATLAADTIPDYPA
jgi:hypothetical protein